MRRPWAWALGLIVPVLAGCGASTTDEAAGTARPDTTAAVAGAPTDVGDPPRSSPPAVPDGPLPVGTSAQGRPITSLSVGHGPRRVLFIDGIHGDEQETGYSTAQLPGAFAAAGLADAVTLTIVADANPDGRAAGTRYNANGVDLNRNFPASNFDAAESVNGGTALSQPESRALLATVDRVTPQLVIVAHSWAGDEFINFDGPARPIAELFSAASGLPVRESDSFTPTPGSLGSYLGRDRGTPVLTIEVRKGSDPEQVWEQIRAAVIEVVRS